MRLLYHHRTRSTDAQRIHILEMVQAFRQIGNEVELVSLVDTEKAREDATRDAATPSWQRLVRKIPFAYDLIQLGYNLVGFPLLVWKLLTGRYEAVYERYSLYNFSGVLAARLCRLPIVLEVNSPFSLEQVRDNEIYARRLAIWTERWICNRATSVVVVSSPLRRILEEQGVKASKIVVMSNGVNREQFREGKPSETLRRSLGLEGKIVVGFVGWFRKWHGLELLVEAFAQSGLDRENAVLLLVGDGPAMADLRQMVMRSGLEGSVIFTGPLPHGRVAEHMRLFDVAVQPAANEYCCPMKILEYLAAGKPVAAPRQDNITELLHEGTEGIFFEPTDAGQLSAALQVLVRDPAKRQQMGAACLAAIEQRGYLWTKNAEAVCRLFDPDTRVGTRSPGLMSH